MITPVEKVKKPKKEKKEKKEKKAKRPKEPKKKKTKVAAAGPRDTKDEEGGSSTLSAWWRELALAAIVVGYVLVYLVAHPASASADQSSGVMEFEGRGGVLYANGEPFSFKGVNWFGSEAFNGPPGGLDKHSAEWYCDFLQRNQFNAIRLLFNHEHVLKDDIVDAPAKAQLLFQKRYVEMFKVLARVAAERGILVMIACHRINQDAWPGSGLWYDTSLGFPESRVLQSWSKIASALCGQWNVVAADLQNEPHASSWGKGLDVDWNKAAERIGNHVLGLCPRWLIMVEGVGYTPGAPGADDPGAGYWWGENLVGAKVAPVQLRDQSKLVYSPHVYGPSVYMQKYFNDFNFPNNMPAVWQTHFAFAQGLGTPIVIGEIGGDYLGKDKQWQDWAIPYLKGKKLGIFYFALNPDSVDTGGLVPKDWSEPEEGSVEFEKLQALSGLPSTDVFEICPACRPSNSPSKPDDGSSSSETVAPADADSSELVDIVLAVLVALMMAVFAFMRHRGGSRRAATVPTIADDDTSLDDGAESPARRPSVNGLDEAPKKMVDAAKEEVSPSPTRAAPAPPAKAASKPKKQEPAGAASELKCGMRVRITGLASAAQYNGMEGLLVSCLPSPAGDRWNVTCDDGTNLNLRPANLKPLVLENSFSF